MSEYYDLLSQQIKKSNFEKIIHLFTPPGYGKSVKIPEYLAKKLKLKILVVEPDQLYADYFKLRTKSVDYISSQDLWEQVIENYNKKKCNLKLKYDLVIFDDYHDGNTEYEVLIRLLKECKYDRILLTSSNVYKTDIQSFDVEKIVIPFNPFHTDIRYHDVNYEWNDNKLLKDISKLVISFNDSSVEGNFLVILPKAYQVNILYDLLMKNKTENTESLASEKENIVLKYTHYDSLVSLNDLLSKETISDTRKILIITDRLEPLVSLPRIGIIFETGFESSMVSTLSGSTRRMVIPISLERLGKYCSRLNVTFPGICFRMFTKDKIEKRNLITKTGLFWYRLLQLKSKGIEFNDDRLKESFDTLKLLNICNDYKEPSCIFCHKSKLSIRNSLILFNNLKSKNVSQLIIILCFIDTYDTQFYRFPKKEKDEIDAEYTLRLMKVKQEVILKYGGQSDLHSFVNIWNELMKNGEDNVDLVNMKLVNSIKYFQLMKLIKDMFNFVSNDYKVKIDSNLLIAENIIDDFRADIANVYQDRIISLDSNENYYIDSNDKKYRLDQKFSINLFSSNPPKSVVNLVSINVNIEGGLTFVVLALNI